MYPSAGGRFGISHSMYPSAGGRFAIAISHNMYPSAGGRFAISHSMCPSAGGRFAISHSMYPSAGGVLQYFWAYFEYVSPCVDTLKGHAFFDCTKMTDFYHSF